jgi:sodium/potassium-transporting ATPase subunit alpha
MITGESEPVDSTVVAADVRALEARNLIFSGSLVVDGACLAVVVRTGDATLIGTMVELTGDVGKASSTLKNDIEYFVKLLTYFAIFQSIVVIIVGLAKGLDPATVFIQGFVIIMVGNVPQGLPTTVTACLFIVADSMGKQNVFVKKLDVIETLGSCTLICTDKTGTLTQNVMSVANVWVPAAAKLDGNGPSVGRSFTDNEFSQQLVEQSQVAPAADGTAQWSPLNVLCCIASLNSRVALERKEDAAADSPLEPVGDATELGLYRFFSACISTIFNINMVNFRDKHSKLLEIPFNSAFKWQCTVHKNNMLLPSPSDRAGSSDANNDVVYVKGAPDVLLKKCGFFLAADGSLKHTSDEQFQAAYTEAYERFGGNGERVLGFAYKLLNTPVSQLLASNPNFKDILKEQLIGHKAEIATHDLVFAGLVTLMDPPRPEVTQAVTECGEAGVRVVMVTGDHPLTAAAIARKIGE